MNWNFFKRNKPETKPIVEDDYLPTRGCGLLSGLFSSMNPQSLSAVFSAVELISNSIAQLPIMVKTKSENKSEIIQEHNVYNVFENSELTKFQLLKNIVVDMLLYGNGLIYIERNGAGIPQKLHYCPNGSYTIHCTSNYFDNKKVIYRLNNLRKAKNVESCDVIHIFKNSIDGYSGRGVLDYAKETIKLASYAEKSASSYFQNGMNIGGILSTSQPKLSSKVKEEIRDAWVQAHGSADSNGIAVLEAGMTYQAVGSNSKDSQLLETRLFSIQEIARFFNINPVLLGDLSKSSYSTIEASNQEFLSHTLMPIITLIQDEFNRKLLLPTERQLYIDLDETYLIKADKSSTANYLSTLVTSGILSINEARRTLGMNPIDGGDKHTIAYTDVNQNDLSNDEL